MKKFVDAVMSLKSFTGLFFMALVMVYIVFSFLFAGATSMQYTDILQMLGVALAASALQFLFLGDHVIKRMAEPARITLFALLLLAVVAAFVFCFGWLPFTWLNLLWVCLAYAGVLLIAGLVFHIARRITGQRYTQMLMVYKEDHL